MTKYFLTLLIFTSVPLWAAVPIDSILKDRIRSNLLVDERVQSSNIELDVENRVATLRGEVGHLPARRAAGQIAASTYGIGEVRNLLTVSESGRSDEAIRRDVVRALADDPAVDLREVYVRVDAGSAMLDGKVDSYTEKLFAEEAATSVHGVNRVVNRLNVLVPQLRSDHEIETDVEVRLNGDIRLARYPLQADVENGVVFLMGEVDSALQKYWARTMAWVAGAREVDASQVSVRTPAVRANQADAYLDAEPSGPGSAEDRILRERVRTALAHDPRLSSSQLEVSVQDRLVILTDTASTLYALRQSEEVAQNTAGVHRVQNNIRLRTTQATANEILEDRAQRAINRDPYFQDDLVRVMVKNGEATLAGRVDTVFERNRIERLVASINGIRSITNGVMVEPL